jgi:hypothetical protein
MVRRIEHHEFMVIQIEQIHATESLRLNQIAFRASQECNDAKSQLNLSRRMVEDRDCQIVELQTERDTRTAEVTSLWARLNQETDARRLQSHQHRDDTRRIRSNQARIHVLVEQLATAEIAQDRQRRLSELLAEQHRDKSLADNNVIAASGAGLLTTILGSIFLTPFVGIPAGAAVTLATLGDKESTKAYNDLPARRAEITRLEALLIPPA